MQIKAESKLDKKVLNTLFTALQTNEILNKNVKTINLFFDIFDKIKNHRTLQKICQVYTLYERQLIFSHYCSMIDQLEEHMNKFQQFSIGAVTKKNKIIIEKQKYPFDSWRQAVQYISYEGQSLTQAIQVKLKLIMRAFNLNSKLKSLNWKRWRDICTDGIAVKKYYCGCFT